MKPYPALCKDCRYSEPEVGSEWNLRCHHPVVNARDSWALAACGKNSGSTCHTEREKGYFSACGMRGKLWVSKEEAINEQDRAQMEAECIQAIDDFKSYDDWQYADREAARKWMFERGWNERNKKVIELQARIDALMSALQTDSKEDRPNNSIMGILADKFDD